MDRYAKLVILAALCSASAAFAQTYKVGQYMGSLSEAERFVYHGAGSAAQAGYHAKYTPGAAYLGSGANVRMSGTGIAQIGGRGVPLTVTTLIPKASVLTGLRALASGPATIAVLVGFAAWEAWMQHGDVKWNNDPATKDDQPFLIRGPGCNGSTCLEYRGYSQTSWFPTQGAACNDFISGASSADANNRYRFVSLGLDGRCDYQSQPVSANPQTGAWANGFRYPPTRSVVDQGSYQPATWDGAQPRFDDAATRSTEPVDWSGVLPGLMQRGGSIPRSDTTNSTVTGPASQQGQRTERNLSNGDKSVTQTTHNYTYNTNNVTHNTTTTTTVTNVNNEVVKEEEETTDNEAPQEPPPDLCEKNPEILACQKVVLKDLQAKDVPNENRPLAITPDSGWSQGAGACPQPKTITFMGTQLAFEYTLFCDFASAIKPLFIGFAWLSATLTFFGIARRD